MFFKVIIPALDYVECDGVTFTEGRIYIEANESDGHQRELVVSDTQKHWRELLLNHD